MSDWAFVRLSEILTESKIIDSNPDPDRKIRVKLNCNGVEKRPLMSEKEGATKNYIRKSGQFIYGKQNFHKGAFGVIPVELDGFSSSGDLPAFDVDGRCLPQWIDYWFKTDNRYLHLAKYAKGVGSQRVNVKSFLQETIALPNLKLQKHIINNINKSNLSLETLNRENQNQSSYLTKLRQSILQEAIEGKLTADWRKEQEEALAKDAKNAKVSLGELRALREKDPNYDAEALLEKIQAEKEKLIKDGKIKKQKPLAPIKAEEVPFVLSEGWVWTKLGDISSVGTGATPLTTEETYYKNGTINWITSSSTGSLFIEHPDKLITEKAIKETNCQIYPINTLVIAMYGQGKTRGQISELKIPAATNQALAAIQLYLSANSHRTYIKNFFMNHYLEIRKLASGGAQPNLNMEKVKTTFIPLPPLVEQQTIVNRVEKLLSMVDELEKQVSERKEQSEQLMQAVLREAFEGNTLAKDAENAKEKN